MFIIAPANIVWEVYRNRSVCPSVCLSVCPFVRLSGPISTSFVRFPPNFVDFKIMMCERCSIKDFIVHWAFLLSCRLGLRNFETIHYSLCHRKFSYMINQKLQDPNMKMCTLVGYPGPLSFTPVMLLWTSKFWDNSVCTLSSQILLHD
jgi:hypothetical protein